jgi:hypothetical protein
MDKMIFALFVIQDLLYQMEDVTNVTYLKDI